MPLPGQQPASGSPTSDSVNTSCPTPSAAMVRWQTMGDGGSVPAIRKISPDADKFMLMHYPTDDLRFCATHAMFGLDKSPTILDYSHCQ